MSNSLVKSLSKKSGLSIKDVEKLWVFSRGVVSKDLKIEDPNFFPRVIVLLKSLVKSKSKGIKR